MNNLHIFLKQKPIPNCDPLKRKHVTKLFYMSFI